MLKLSEWRIEMKLAEALLERKNAKQKIEALQARLEENVLVQEGDQPGESRKR